MSAPLHWEREGRRWPNREASQFVDAAGLRWHVQRLGKGPELLLLHGTGASCHSWRAAMPLLAERFTLTVPDLPGHGFTSGRLRGGATLAHVTAALGTLLDTMRITPAAIAAHSAGCAISLEHCLVRQPNIPMIGFAPAIMPFPGLAAKLFPAMAKMLFVNPLVPRLFAGTMSLPGEVHRFLKRATGSAIAPEDLACYETLLGHHRHCEGALAMMAHWDLESLAARLPHVTNPVLLVHGRRDKAVPAGSVEGAAARLPDARLALVPELGHLLHEEAPELAADRIIAFAREHGVLPAEATA